MDKRRNRVIVCLCLFIFMLSISSLFTLNNQVLSTNNTDFKTSTDNYLFNGKEYDMTLDDVYDDADPYKTYTGANFSYVFMENESTTFNEVVSPVNNNENKSPDLGDYPATYSFENDADGSIPNGWSKSGTGTVEIQANKDNHTKVIYLLSGAPATAVYANQYFDTGHYTGVVELWWYAGYGNDWNNQLQFYNTQNMGYFFVSSDNIYWYDFTTSTLIASDIMNQWNHLKTSFDGNNVSVSVNQESNISVNFRSAFPDTPSRLTLFTYDERDCWFDGILYSWDPEHTPSEHHAGTYSFINDADGSAPADWTGNINDYEVDTSHLDHNKVLASIGDGVGGKSLVQNLGGWKTELVMDWWWNLNNYSHSYVIFNLKNNTESLSHRMIAYGASATPVIGCDNGGYLYPTALGWHHYKVEIDCATNLISYWMDDELLLADKGFRDDFEPDYITSIQLLFSSGVPIGEKVYWDGFGFGHDPYYTIGDNLLPSLGNTMPVGLNMINGTYDYTDNIQEYDGSYTSFFSTDLPDIHEETPVIWSDFAYTYGSNGGTSGSAPYLDDNDGSYAYMNSASYVVTSGDTLLGYIEPNGNLISNWNEGDTSSHYLSIDEYPDTNGDGLNLRETSETVHDRWNFGTLGLPENSWVSKLEIKFYTLKQTGSGMYIIITSNELSQTSISMTESYSWRTRTLTGLNLDQTELTALYLDVVPAYSGELNHGYVDIETVYINVYYKTSNTYYRHYSVLTFDYAGGSLDYLDTLYYDYATTVAIDMDLDIWDWVAGSYNVELQSNSGTGYITGSYDLSANPNKVSGTNQVRVRFETSGTTTTDFDVRIDQLMFDYVLTTDADPELEAIMETTFSNYNDPDLLGIEVESWHKTDVAQTIVFSIYNYNTPAWETITSQSQISFTQSLFQSTSVSDYFDGSGNMKIRYYGTSSTQDFDLYVDNLNITIFYKMDLTHAITFNTNGLWKYRWTLFGSIQYTDWTYFEVVDPVPNFNTISQSEVLSRWILQGADISPIEDFHDDINTNAWDLYGVDRTMSVELNPTEDSATLSNYPTTNVGQSPDYSLMETTQTRYIFFKSGSEDIPYFTDNISTTTNGTLNLYQIDPVYHDAMVYLYQTSSFDEDIITWNNQPAPIGDYLTITDDTSTYNTWASINLGNTIQEYYFINVQVYGQMKSYRSSEASSNKPKMTYYLYKNYFGEGYMYMQTGSTELIGLESPDYGTHKTLSSGDYFEVDFETSSDSQINLILLKGGEVQKSLVLSQSGNTNFNRHTAQISVSEDLEFDQLKISSTFEDQDNVKVYDIKTYKYTVTGDYKDFYVSPNNQKEVYLTPDTYNLRIFEEGDKKVDVNLTIPVPDDYYIYTPLPNQQCRLSLFSPDDIYLPLTDYHIDVNRSLNGEYNQFALLGDVFNVDMDTWVYIDIYDRFNTLIDSFTRLASDYIDLELEVYQLQIKNLMEQMTTFDINSSYIYPLLSGEKIEFMLAESYYNIGYYDMDNDYHQFIIYLNSNQAFELNRSKICFLSYADQQGNHLSFDNYKTYINGSMIYEQIFYEDAGDDVNITITDRYDYQVYSGIYSVVSGDNFIPITLTMYSLKVMNQQEIFNHINITRDPNYYESEYYWSEWIAPNEIIEFRLFAGYYKINLTDNENSGSSFYAYTLSGDDILLISSDNIISNVIYSIVNVNTTIGNQITNVQIDLTNQNSDINNTIINIDINLSNVNSSLGTLLTNINLDITNINNNISNLYTFTENNFLNLGNNINNSFISIENNIIAINQTISTLVIGLDGKITIVNATITTMFTEMNSQFVVVQSTLDFSFAFLNQTITQIGNNITNNQIALNNLIIQRANDIDNSLIEISTLVNLINSSVVNESLVIQSLVNIIGNNITENHVAINNLINLIGNNITENNVNMISLIELVGNNITTNHFVIQTLIDYVSNNISDNHLEVLTNINFINTTIGQNQIELINRLLFINNSINNMALDLTNQILLVNNTIYSAILDVSVSIDFNSDNILGNISLTYEQNDFLTELYKETMFSSLLNWSDVAFNYSLMENRIDAWEFINHYKNQSIEVHLRYQDIIDNLTITAQNSIIQYLPKYDTDYNLWSVEDQKYLDEWQPLPENRTVPFGFYEAEVPITPRPLEADFYTFMAFVIIIAVVSIVMVISWAKMKSSRDETPEETRLRHKRKRKVAVDGRKGIYDHT